MELKYFTLVCLLFAVASCVPRKRGEDDDDSKGRKKETRQHAQEMKTFISDKFTDLKNFLEETRNAKFDHISEVVEEIRRNQRYVMQCKEGICGDHGTCELSEDEQSYVCHCEEGFGGEHCEITGPCNVSHYNMQQMPPLLGREFPNCDEDGSYAGMQYIGSQAYCVTSENVEIEGYSVNRWETGDMDCQCARDEYAHTHSEHAEEKVFNCLPNGNYPEVA